MRTCHRRGRLARGLPLSVLSRRPVSTSQQPHSGVSAWDTECRGGACGLSPSRSRAASPQLAAGRAGRRVRAPWSACCVLAPKGGRPCGRDPPACSGRRDSRERSRVGSGPGVPRAEPPFVWAPEALRAEPSHTSSDVLTPPAAVSLPPGSVAGRGGRHGTWGAQQGPPGLQSRASQLRQRVAGPRTGNSLCSPRAQRRCGARGVHTQLEKVRSGLLDSRRGCSRWAGRACPHPSSRALGAAGRGVGGLQGARVPARP